jgi:multidrug efflux pump subunit AcrB/ABC-type multidrug transport system ATPase subunit
MNPTNFVIKRKVFISMLFIGVTLLGVISYKQLPAELYPNVELPFLFVQVGASQEYDPEYVESQAIIPVEGAISSLQGIETIESTVDRRQGAITIYFKQNVDLKYAYLRLDEKINALRSQLPDGFFARVYKVDTEQLTNMFMSLQVRGGGGVDRVRQLTEQKVSDELENIDGIAGVQVYGGRQKSVEIIVDEAACQSHDISVAQIRAALGRNSIDKTFLGRAFDGKKKYFVNLLADYASVSDLENIYVKYPVRIKDVAQVFVGVKDPTSISRVNGKDAVTIQLMRDSRENLIDLSKRTRAVIGNLNQKLASQDAEIVIQYDRAEIIERNIDLIIRLALVGGLLAIAILWFFLRNIRLVAIIALAIPISIFTAFNFFYAFGISLNSLTLVGMALAVGMLLDNSVVVLENIYRLVSQKADVDRAVIQGTKEVWRSILAATLTTVTVFLPFVFASNFFVRVLGKISVSIISTLMVSLLVALLLIPMAAHRLIASGRSGKPVGFRIVSTKNRLIQIYNLLLKTSLRKPANTVIIAVVLFFASLLISITLSVDAPREVESKEFNLYVTMPNGSTLEFTDLAVAEIEKKLDALKEKEEVVSQIYEEEAVLTIKLRDDYYDIDRRDIAEIKKDIQDRLRDFRIAETSFDQPQSSQRFRGGEMTRSTMRFERMLGLGTPEERVVIKGRDFARMRNIAEAIRAQIDDLSSINRTSFNLADDRPELHLQLDNQAINQYNISPNYIAAELAGFQSQFSANTTFKIGLDDYDIVLRTGEEQDKTIDELKSLQIPSEGGGLHRLDELADMVYSFGMSGISRVNQEKQIEITYSFLGDVTESNTLLDAARAEIDQIIANMNIPAGIAVTVVHDENELQDFYFLIGAAIILIYMILASVFESLFTPLVMMFTIPLAAVGSLWALILTHNSLFNANTLIGFLILLGVVVNNGIIFIDYTRILRQRGYRPARALMMAGHARLRPIVITTVTTIIALIPLAMGKAEYVTTIGAPFAITMIGGLAMSTLFTLVFIPTVYVGLETALEWMKRLNWKIKIVQFVSFALGCYFIYNRVDSLLWRSIYLVLITAIIPALTYFVLISLRRAQQKILGSREQITIVIRNLVKVYDDHSRFSKGWQKGRKIARQAGSIERAASHQLQNLLWQIPLAGFMVYFVFFYLRNFFWAFVLTHVVYLYLLHLLKTTHNLFPVKRNRSGHLLVPSFSTLYKIALWGMPVIFLTIYYLKWGKPPLIVFIALLWYFALTIYTTSAQLHQKGISIAHITGRFSSLKRTFYRFVNVIPVIGRKKNPFKALSGVSLQIESGMFGLLGPNGAGKTTLMRILCGILEQSRGKVWINGIDLGEKREELQGLIGYLPQEFGTYENMTAYEFLKYQAILKNLIDGQVREERIHYVLGAVHLDEVKDRKIGTFSGGMKQRIGIAQTLLHLPRILVVDEPTAGLDPRERIRFRNLLVELSRERVVVFSTHIIEDISSSCNRVAVLDRGALKYFGQPNQMTRMAQGKVWQALMEPEEFEAVRERLRIVHHARIDKKIRIRCLADSKPLDEAITVQPTLEDAYLWLIGRN